MDDAPACVCGCPLADHQPTVMSVPLPRQTPIYQLPTSLVNNISTTYPGATYCRDECACGCGQYLADPG